MSLNLSTEEKILLRCARLNLGPEDEKALAGLLAEQVDWKTLLEKAKWHRLTGLAYHHLRRTALSGMVPKLVMHQFASAYRYNVAKYLIQKAELNKLLQELAERHITVILLKGSALGETVYRVPGLRAMNDIDLLVPEKHVNTVYEMIQQMGYSSEWSKETEERTIQNHRHMPLLTGKDKPVWFEVHKHITRQDSPLHFDISEFWARATQHNNNGVQALLLAPEHMLIHLCVHFILDRRYHTYVSLGQLCDIAGAIRSYQGGADWQRFVSEVNRYHIRTPIYYALYSAKRLINAQVPDTVLNELKPVDFHSEQTELFLRCRVLDTKEFLAHQLVATRSRYNTFAALGAALGRLAPDKVTLAEQFGLEPSSKRIYLYYPVRWYRILKRVTQSAIKPSQVKTELGLDRWMHSVLSMSNNGAAQARKETR